MSFDLRLNVPAADAEILRELAASVAAAGAWPVRVHHRGIAIEESDPHGDPMTELDLFTHNEMVEGRSLWQSPPGAGERLAQTFLILDAAPAGYTFHAAWNTAHPDRDLDVSADELAALARGSRIDEDILDRVRCPRGGDVRNPPRRLRALTRIFSAVRASGGAANRRYRFAREAIRGCQYVRCCSCLEAASLPFRPRPIGRLDVPDPNRPIRLPGTAPQGLQGHALL